eukprot:TRINITY_DN5254_c3_g1_i1.p1 TRINITY_DN5254_c3_g1~~TRINITY_DN5254_c3_g1_i1.p1  ORF type:complete len:176 (+),score=62.66 TRINITY_DN5254_c3_g1_i1:80-607(+)
MFRHCALRFAKRYAPKLPTHAAAAVAAFDDRRRAMLPLIFETYAIEPDSRKGKQLMQLLGIEDGSASYEIVPPMGVMDSGIGDVRKQPQRRVQRKRGRRAPAPQQLQQLPIELGTGTRGLGFEEWYRNLESEAKDRIEFDPDHMADYVMPNLEAGEKKFLKRALRKFGYDEFDDE